MTYTNKKIDFAAHEKCSHYKMSNSINTLIATIARIKNTCSLIVANEDNDVHLASILADAEFNIYDVMTAYMRLNAFMKDNCLRIILRAKIDILSSVIALRVVKLYETEVESNDFETAIQFFSAYEVERVLRGKITVVHRNGFSFPPLIKKLQLNKVVYAQVCDKLTEMHETLYSLFRLFDGLRENADNLIDPVTEQNTVRY